TDGGTALTLVDVDDAPAGFGGAGTVDAAADGSGLAGGADAEETEAFRARVLARKRRLAQGGNSGDWEEWVREALGATVDRVFVDSFQNDARAVWVAFTVTDQPGGIPTLAQIAIVQAYIGDPVRRPVQARAYAVPLTPVPVPVAIGALDPDTPAIRASIAAELAAVFADRAEPGRPAAPFVLSRSWLDEAVSRATGEDSHDLNGPVGDPVFTAGQMPVYADPTYS
ncbi:baseplate J/gp47 family protein, partial [Methylobacterium sp. E-066]|uniref:baseplate J/gp47 family protein n=1 Tax=Methylobacterium sp. E-066 TaxID=2836584 RepID=UPI001FBB10F6